MPTHLMSDLVEVIVMREKVPWSSQLASESKFFFENEAKEQAEVVEVIVYLILTKSWFSCIFSFFLI